LLGIDATGMGSLGEGRNVGKDGGWRMFLVVDDEREVKRKCCVSRSLWRLKGKKFKQEKLLNF
jgi:hypothetical protein